MLTVRLKRYGIPTAFQTNRVISLLKTNDLEFTALVASSPAIANGGIIDITVDGHVTRVGSHAAETTETIAIVKLDGVRGEMGDAMGDASYPNGARLICLCEGDSAHVVEGGSVLFAWPES